MVAQKTKRVPKLEPLKYLGYTHPSVVPVKVGDRVTIPKGVGLLKPDSWKTFPNPKEIEVEIHRITYGKSYNDWNKEGTSYTAVDVENPKIGFKTNLGVLLVDINEIKFKTT